MDMDWLYKLLNIKGQDKENQIAELEIKIAKANKVVEQDRKEAKLREKLKELGQEHHKLNPLPLTKIVLYVGGALILLAIIAKVVGC